MCVHAGQFNRGGPFPSQGQQEYNQPSSNQQFGYDQQWTNQGECDQQGYTYLQQFGGSQDQRWNQFQAIGGPGPGVRDSNQYNGEPFYQNMLGCGDGVQYKQGGGAQYGEACGQFRDQRGHQVGVGGALFGGGGDPYGESRSPHGGGGAQYGRNQGPYDDIPNMSNRQPGMNQGQRGGMQYGTREEYQQGGLPVRAVQDVPHRPKEAWGDTQVTSNNQPWDISMCNYTELHIIHKCY